MLIKQYPSKRFYCVIARGFSLAAYARFGQSPCNDRVESKFILGGKTKENKVKFNTKLKKEKNQK